MVGESNDISKSFKQPWLEIKSSQTTLPRFFRAKPPDKARGRQDARNCIITKAQKTLEILVACGACPSQHFAGLQVRSVYQLLKTQQPIANDDGDDDGGGGDNNDNDDDNDDADDDNDDDNNACNNAPADDDDDNDYNVDDDKCRVYPTDSGGSPTLGSLSSMLIFQGVDNKNDGLGKMYLFSTMASFCISITHFRTGKCNFSSKTKPSGNL